jgi:hypothetical protein
MDKTLRFEIDVEYEERKWKHANCSKHQLMAEILPPAEERREMGS